MNGLEKLLYISLKNICAKPPFASNLPWSPLFAHAGSYHLLVSELQIQLPRVLLWLYTYINQVREKHLNCSTAITKVAGWLQEAPSAGSRLLDQKIMWIGFKGDTVTEGFDAISLICIPCYIGEVFGDELGKYMHFRLFDLNNSHYGQFFWSRSVHIHNKFIYM